MRKIGRVLLLSMSALFLLGFLLTTACGSSATGNTNGSIKTPIERIQSLELGLLSVQTGISKGTLDYGIIQSRVDKIREDLDTLVTQINNIITDTQYTNTTNLFSKITANITILQGLQEIITDNIAIIQEAIISLEERMDFLEVTCNAS